MEKKYITAPLQIISSNFSVLPDLMSLEIGEITFFCVAFISAGDANLWGLVSSLWDCAVRCRRARCDDESSKKLSRRPVNRRGSSQ